MLGKLIKHEYKATVRNLVPLYLVLIFISIINRFVISAGAKEGLIGFFTGFLVFAQVLLIIVILIATFLLMIIRFYKNLLSDEGYLMFTLPVKTHQLITSKLIITMLWTVVSCLMIVVSLFLAFSNVGNLSMISNELQSVILEIRTIFGEAAIFGFITFVILSIISSILMIYASIAIGHLFKKHRIVASFVAYAVLYNAVQIILVGFLAILGLATDKNVFVQNMMPETFLPSVIIFTFILGVIFYITTNYIFKRKLNLD